MQMPLQVTFRSMAHSDALTAHVERRVAKLGHLFRGLISCHVVVELVGHHQRHGDRYRVLVNLGLPGRELVVDHAPSDDGSSRTPTRWPTGPSTRPGGSSKSG